MGGRRAGERAEATTPFSRCATGWVADATDETKDTELSELDELEGISQQQLRAALAPTMVADTPVGAQHTANVERARWAVQWAVDEKPDELDWPEHTEVLESISLKQLREALFTFPAGTGLGCDGIHPRALLRLSDEELQHWLAFFLKCERIGSWPKGVGVVIVVLLPKADGGFRPVGLIPNSPDFG